MLSNNVLDRFERQRFWRLTTISIAAVLGICVLSGIFVFAIVMGSAPGRQKGTQSAESRPEMASTALDQTVSPAPVMQSAPIIPTMRFDLPDRTESDWYPKTDGSDQASLHNVPMPVARPNPHVIGQMQKATKYEIPNKTSKNKNDIDKRDRPINQVEDTKPQSKPIVHEAKTSEIDARKTAALELEQSYINAGVAISTHVSGLNGTVLNIEYPKFNDALVQKIMGVHSFATTLGKVGFTKIVFTADQDKTWAFPLQLPSQSDNALQEPASGNK